MIYFNNGATSFPKFKCTVEAMEKALSGGEMFCNRDSVGYTDVARKIFDLRTSIGDLIHAKEPYDICFTQNATVALNLLVFGSKSNDHKKTVIISSEREHNSVSRPLAQVTLKHGKTSNAVLIGFREDGSLDLEHLKEVLKIYRGRIRFAIFSYASNVTGDVLDGESVGQILYENNIPFIVDASQALGYTDIDVEKMHISALVFAGHKGLNGPQGTGGFYVRKSYESMLKPILFGGTGNNSSKIIEPEPVFPDSFEVGTPPVHDLLGLHASIRHIVDDIGIEKYQRKICSLANLLQEKLSSLQGLKIYGNPVKKTPIISFNVKGKSPKEVGKFLGEKGIVCRTGVLCSALAMEDLGIEGCVRFSLGYFNTEEEINEVVSHLKSFMEA